MITLTTKEKASRYDALQAAIRIYLDHYQKQAKQEIPEKIQGCLRAYDKGRQDAAEEFAELLGRWMG